MAGTKGGGELVVAGDPGAIELIALELPHHISD